MIRFASNYNWWHPKYWSRSIEECKYMKIRWLKELRRAVKCKHRLGKIITCKNNYKVIVNSITYDSNGMVDYTVQEYRECQKN